MSALAKTRSIKAKKASTISLPSTAEQVYQGGLACLDTSTGLVKKGAASTTLKAIGLYAETVLVASGGVAPVNLFRELVGVWFVNSASTDAIAQAQVGSTCFVVDDQTVAKTDGTGTRSVAGTVWMIDSVKGVLVDSNVL